MKLNVLKNTAIVFISLCTVMSCVKDDDCESPDNKKVLPALAGKVVSFSDVASRATAIIKTCSVDEAIEGYVISNDEGDNFYKKIYIQNEDKTQALSVILDKSGIYTELPVGAKVQLHLRGFTTQLNNAVTEVSCKIYKNEKSGRESVGFMVEAIYKTHLYGMGGERKILASLAKEVTSIGTVKNNANAGQLITLKDVHFPNEVVDKTMYDKNKDLGGATNYKLIDANGKTIGFRTSSYAKFKDEKVPAGALDITGVLFKFNTSWQFMVSNYADIKVVSGATTASTQTSIQTATVVALDVATATVVDYVVDKRVKLHGIIIVKSNRTYITFKDGTEIQIYAPREVTLFQAAKDKLLMAGYGIVVTGVFTDYPLKSGIVVKETIYSRESDIESIKAPATVPQITTLDTTTATVADFEANKDKRVSLKGTLTPEARNTYIHLSGNARIQVFIMSNVYKKLLAEAKSRLKTAGQEIEVKGTFDVYNSSKQIKCEDANDLVFKN